LQKVLARLRTILILTAAAIVTLAVAGSIWFSTHFSPIARDVVVKAIQDRFDSDVELKSLSVSLLPRPHAVGEGLVLHFKKRRDIPPLFTIRRLTIDAGFSAMFEHPARVSSVRLEGLQIHVSPHSHEDHGGQQQSGQQEKPKTAVFVIDRVIADGTTLEILPKQEGKDPLEFELSKLTLHDAGINSPMTFRATMTNPKPPGNIQTTGQFGPWQQDDPGQTPVAGNYTFRNADLSIFKGIAGILSSDGKYHGTLEHIEVAGTTDIPNFSVSTGGHPVHLTTEFQSVVDGTDGDTYLQPVTAHFLNSTIVASGKVEGKKGQKGKTVTLDAVTKGARIEDMLRMVVKGDKPLMKGALGFQAKFSIPPGDRDVMHKLDLKGTFGITGGHFTTAAIQEKIDTLSKKGQGRPDEVLEGTASNLRGNFALNNSVMHFSKLSFNVPGAGVQVAGAYGLADESLDFEGALSLEAKLSETMTGWKSKVLRWADPLFSRNGAGAVVPFEIRGTRTSPSFRLDVKRVLARD
jgi:hypothetical protein